MIREFATVILKSALPDHQLPAGIEGTVVDALHIAEGFVTVEFFDQDETVAVLPVLVHDLESVGQRTPKHAHTHVRPRQRE